MWTKHKMKLPAKLKKLLVCYICTPNLRDLLVRAQFSDCDMYTRIATHYNTVQYHPS